jgi:UDP-N-acetylmuramoyl-L-alanyl-D-glutamate--2,6-diaminopimelate ligase
MTIVPMPVKKCELLLSEIIPCLEAEKLLSAKGKSLPPGSTHRGILRTDSRKVTPGDIFLAYKGVASDGHSHIQEAVQKGAAFLILEDTRHLPDAAKDELPPWVEVKDGRSAWSSLSSLAFGHPEKSLKILAVTGTNGKTSTVWMAAEILNGMGIPCLTIGTLGARLGDEEYPTNHTTPDPDILFGLLCLARDRGVKVVAMEVSSHALAQAKVRGLLFAGCAFTSFSRDHLDFHPTMEAYWDAKWSLFIKHTSQDSLCIFSDELPDPRLNSLSHMTIVYGFHASETAKNWQARQSLMIKTMGSTGLTTELSLSSNAESTSGRVSFFAKHTLENLAAAALLAMTVTGSLPSGKVLAQVRPVPGRLEPVSHDHGPQVVVDYAHTPDALEKTLEVLRPACKGRLIVVFGCGGDRDPGKRPIMGRVAYDHADIIFITSDNPRTEDPLTIIQSILTGIPDRRAVRVLSDRGISIQQAIMMADADDVVLIAGKGHENYQIIGKMSLPFDDRLVALEALKKKEPKR